MGQNKKLVFFGHGGSYNHGCEAIVRSTIKILKEQQAEIHLYSHSPQSDKDFGLENDVILHEGRVPLKKTNPKHAAAMVLYKFLHKDSLYLNTFFRTKMNDIKDTTCLSIGGDMYCYGRLPWLYDTHKRLKINGNRTILWGCSVDINSFFPEALEDLKRYDLIITRESISYELFQKHGLKNVKLYPDPAFCLDKQETTLPFNFHGENTIAINVSPLMNRYHGGASLLGNLTRLLNHIIKDTKLDIVLIPHVNGYKEAEDDYTFLKKIAEPYQTSKRVFLLERNLNCCQLKYVISKCRFLMTARTHASIAAYSTGVPTVVLGYSVKSRGIAKDIFGTEENYVIPVQNMKTEDDLANAFDWLMENETAIKEHLLRVMPDYIQKSASASDEII